MARPSREIVTIPANVRDYRADVDQAFTDLRQVIRLAKETPMTPEELTQAIATHQAEYATYVRTLRVQYNIKDKDL